MSPAHELKRQRSQEDQAQPAARRKLRPASELLPRHARDEAGGDSTGDADCQFYQEGDDAYVDEQAHAEGEPAGVEEEYMGEYAAEDI